MGPVTTAAPRSPSPLLSWSLGQRAQEFLSRVSAYVELMPSVPSTIQAASLAPAWSVQTSSAYLL